MNNILLILFLLFNSYNHAFAQVIVTHDELPNTDTTDSKTSLNNQLRQSQNAINTIGAYFNSNGYLSQSSGGTGVNLSSVPNGSILVEDTGNVGIGTFGQGTSGQFLESQGAGVNPIWGTPTDINTSNVVFEWSGNLDVAGSGSGFITSTTTLNDTGSANGSYAYLKSRNTTTSQTDVMLRSKFMKIAGINTLTIYAYVWEDVTTGSSLVSAQLNVNGTTADTGTVSSTSPTWTTAGTINVSALSNGSLYDLSIAIKNTNASGTHNSYMGSVIVYGS